jgi:hypothetical protein
VLQANRREYRRITGHGLDRAAAASGDIDKNLGESAAFEEAEAGCEVMAGMFKVQQLMSPALRKPPS